MSGEYGVMVVPMKIAVASTREGVSGGVDVEEDVGGESPS